MIKKLIYLCPVCHEEDTINQIGNSLHCSTCQSHFPFLNNFITFSNIQYELPYFYDLIKQKLLIRTISKGPVLRESKQAILRQGIKRMIFRGFEREYTIIEKPVDVAEGILKIEEDRLRFQGAQTSWIFNISDIMGFSTNSKYLEFKIRDKPFFQIYFKEESPLKYEDLLIKWYKQYSSFGAFIEHQPILKYKIPSPLKPLIPHPTADANRFKEKFSIFELILHLLIGLPVTHYLKHSANLQFRNKELIPRQGPCILIANHESYLDPILLSTLSPRRIGFFTKSTSFANRILQPILRAYRSIPNRRYETDPIVIRQAIRRLKTGHCIGIFPEGERTWDGRLGDFKYSTIRFILSAQVPVVVVNIKGGYRILPRWSKRHLKGEMVIDVMKCFSLLPGEWNLQDLKASLESSFQSEYD